MAYFVDSFHAKAEAELDARMNAPRWEVLATELLVSIDWVLKTGLEPGEFPVTFCRDWSPLYIRCVGGYLYSLTLVFTVTGLAGPVPTMRILSIDSRAKRAMDNAVARC